MRYDESKFRAVDGSNLFVRTYASDESDRCARTLVILHGTSEHGGRYHHFSQFAVKNGWNVVVPDLRGHGRSDGIPVHVDQFEQYLQDLDTLWQYCELNPHRTALLGHSFGGLISARFAQTRTDRLAALALMSPLLGLRVKVDPFTYALGRVMSVIAPTTRFQSKVDPEFTTHCPDALERRNSDPLIHRSVTASWFFEMKSALAGVWRDAAKQNVPVLAIQAGDDRIVDPDAVVPWLEKTSHADTSFHLIDDAYHELLNEPDWEITAGMVLEWLERRLPCSIETTRNTRTEYTSHE